MSNQQWSVPSRLAGFERAEPRSFMGCTQFPFRKGKLSVIVTVDDYETSAPGAGVWAHASVARSDRDPTWAEIKLVRDAVFGAESVVAQVLAPASKWLNVHEHCFHLWMRIDAPTLPSPLYDQMGADGSAYGKIAKGW